MDAYGLTKLQEALGLISFAWNAFLDSLPGPSIALLVALMWGCTNPFLKRYSSPNGLLSSLKSPLFVLSFACNQLGSALYLVALHRMPLALAQPLCNGLTFVVTAVAGALLFSSSSAAPADPGSRAVAAASDKGEDAAEAIDTSRLVLAATLITAGIALSLSDS